MAPEIAGWLPVNERPPTRQLPAASRSPNLAFEMEGPMPAAMGDSPDLAAAKRLLDDAKDRGFVFQRIATGEDGPLRGVRETPGWLDQIILSGFRAPDSCSATRRRRSTLILPGGPPVTEQVLGDALTVLHTVVSEWRI